MPRDERQDRQRQLWQALLRTDISEWGEKFLATLVGHKPSETSTTTVAA
jgi:trehalose-6-phosphate synthase